MQQLTPAERRCIDNVVRGNKASPTDALHKINGKRVKAGVRPVEKSCVHRYVKGLTHNVETQGCCVLGNEMLHSLNVCP